MTKLCIKCVTSKDLDDFTKARNICKICTNKYQKSNYKKRKPKYKTEKERIAARRKSSNNWKINNKRHNKGLYLKFMYGITIDEYETLLKKQECKCNICQINMSEFTKALHVDHDHTTGKVRGLLCENCNRGLGMFKDNIEFLLAAIIYLNNHKDVINL